MSQTDLLGVEISEVWRYALIGGLVSIPLSLGSWWLSGTESYVSLNMVFVGGLLAGYLAATRSSATDSTTVGLATGVVGGLPGIWIAVELLEASTAAAGPIWFRILTPVAAIVFVMAVLFGVAAIVGVLGASVGGWLAAKIDRSSVLVEA